MQCVYCSVTKNCFDSLANSADEIYDYFENIGKHIEKDEYLVLDKTWDLVYYILTGESIFELDEGGGFPFVFGNNILGVFDADGGKIGPIRYISEEGVLSCIQLFDTINREEFINRFDFEDILSHNVYFDKMLDPEGLMERSIESLEALNRFFKKALTKNNVLLVYFD
ncbi:MAG: YfbM family protein [Clostridiales bacterium]|jgi:hypothetical protein|nr:YfbM family protein [Clostridiales bacterium]